MNPRIFGLIKNAAARLGRVSDAPDADAWELLMAAAGLDRGELVMRDELEAGVSERFEGYIKRRELGEPAAYITNRRGFMEDIFYVDNRVLIPRPDTEILVLRAIELIKERGYRSALEIGAGSGCVAISLAKMPGIEVTAADISEGALSVARLNAQRIGANVEFVLSDCFSALAKRRFDVVISNPPYLTEGETAALPHEPRTALYGGKDGLSFYKRITEEAADHLKPGGLLIFEIGWDQRNCVAGLLEANGFENIENEKDYDGNDRVVWGFRRNIGD